MYSNVCRFLLVCALLLVSYPSLAQSSGVGLSPEVANIFHMIWISICAILVFIMQAGFTMLESGLVRAKNCINVIMKNFTDIGISVMGFWLIGYALMYGENTTGWIGTSGFMPSGDDSSAAIDLFYQMMFAATAATIVSGAVAERFRFLHYIIGAFFITTIIYPVFGSWVWGGNDDSPGWLAALGFYDAAGGTVVHSIGAWASLGALIVLGPRYGRYSRKGSLHEIPGHSLPYVAIGGFLLWFGWFGFNGGTVNDDFSNLGLILLNTQLGAISGVCGTIAWLVVTNGKLKTEYIVNGGLAGLVSITAGVDVLTPYTSVISGLIGGVILVTSSNFLDHWRIDDVIGAIPVHGFCGAWGTLAAGLFYSGDMFNIERIIIQLVGISVAFIWGLSTSFLLYFGMNKISKIRVSTQLEQGGLDIAEHHDIGYSDFMVSSAKSGRGE